MKIEIVQLENIRSHVKSTVPFARGFNCLVGALGCGKSSILYAIDFALFGDPIGRSFEYLLREGADAGRITVEFTQTGRTYKMVRGLRRHGKGISQDFEELKLFEDETLIASMKGDAVAEQFKAITGLDKDLYREIVWVRQEHLKELLDAAPRDRQRRLDELFGLSDYEIAWTNIAEYQRDYEKEKKILEKDPDVTGMEKLTDDHNRVTEEFARLEVELQDAVAQLVGARKALENADLRLKKLEEKRLFVEELRRKEAQLQANLGDAASALASLSLKIEGKKSVIENLKQRQQSVVDQTKTYIAKLNDIGISTAESSDSAISNLTDLDDRISRMRAEQEATQRNMQTDQKRLTSLYTENRCPLCLQPLNTEYKNGLLQRLQEENEEKERIIKDLQGEITELQQVKFIANDAFSNLQVLKVKAEHLRAQIDDEERNLSEISMDSSKRQEKESAIQQELEGVRFEICRFDLAELEAARTLRERAFGQYHQFESELRIKENRKKDLLSRMDEIKERIDHAQEKIERMGKISRTVEVIGAIRDAYRGIQPKLRGEFVKVLRNFVQQVLDGLVGETPLLNVIIDETYTPYVLSESGAEREVANLSGGERTLLAFAYRLGLGQLIMQSRTGHGLSMLLLDEPTESLGREDGSIDRLAEAISRFKAIEQIIAVTHSEAFAERAEHVVTLEKEAGISKVSIER